MTDQLYSHYCSQPHVVRERGTFADIPHTSQPDLQSVAARTLRDEHAIPAAFL
jgi:hypothetical protein